METREAAEEAAARFIARRDVGPWTEADASALDDWLAESAGHRVAYYRLNGSWTEAGRLKVLGGAGQAEVTSTIARQRGRWVAVAACLVLALFAAIVWQELADRSNTYSTPIGATEVIPLADGSRLTLNTNSLARTSIGEHERRIYLDRGEIYLEVAHDPGRPFIVQAGSRRVIALGTQFSVRRDQDSLRVSVTEGTVRLESAVARDRKISASDPLEATKPTEVLLSAGTVARAEHDAVLVQERSLPEVKQSLSWRAGLLTFRGTPLAEAVAEFNRYNRRRVVIGDPAITSILVGGIFHTTNVDRFVHLLEEGFPIRARTRGDQIILTSRQ